MFTTKHQRRAAYGRVRQRKAYARRYPKREQFNLREAARRAGLNIRACECEIYNPHATGKRRNLEGTWQWIDVVATHPDLGLLAIDIEERDPRWRERYETEKRKELDRRGIPYLTCKGRGRNQLEAEITVWLMKLERAGNVGAGGVR